MALDRIEAAITSSARTEAERIEKAAQMAAQARIETERADAERAAARRYESGARAIDDEMARRMLQVKGNASKQLLERRNTVLERVFTLARDAVLAWPRDRYAKVMRRYLERAVGGEGGTIRIHPAEKDTFEHILSAFNTGRANDQKVAVDDANPLAARGGFVFVAQSFEIDQTLDTLLAEFERELAPAIAVDLFGGAAS